MKAPEIETIVPKVLARLLELLPSILSILKSPSWMNLETGDSQRLPFYQCLKIALYNSYLEWEKSSSAEILIGNKKAR